MTSLDLDFLATVLILAAAIVYAWLTRGRVRR